MGVLPRRRAAFAVADLRAARCGAAVAPTSRIVSHRRASIMGYRNDDERFRERDREHARFDRDEDMGGSFWSGASGRGGMVDPQRDHMRFDRNGYAEMERMGGWAAHEERGPYWGKGPKGYRRTDERINDDVCESIAHQGWIDAGDVEVRVESGVVVLTGTVAQRQDKRRLELMAERVHGVDDVRNEIRVRREREREREGEAADPQPAPSPTNGNRGGARP
jgi:hypothetical protein